MPVNLGQVSRLMMSSLADVTIIITTFLRDGYLYNCLGKLKANLPECKVVVVDDGYPTREKTKLGLWTTYLTLPFDSGLSAKRNAGVAACRTKYLLLGCDDFDFGTNEAKNGINRLIEVLDNSPELDIASGRVNNYAYEGFLEHEPKKYIKAHWLKTRPVVYCGYGVLCDITVNYFLMRVDNLRDVKWDERMKIGGEHGDWFLSLKQAGKKVGWVPGVNITTLKLGDGPLMQNPSYRSFRERADTQGHLVFKEKWEIADFVCFNGEVT